MAPIAPLESAVKDAVIEIDKVYRSIKDQEDKFEDERKNRKLKVINGYISEIVSQKYLHDDYARRIELDPRWLNKTFDLDDVYIEIVRQCDELYASWQADKA